jgi:hypothetical protein
VKQITINVSDVAYENMRLVAEMLNTPEWSDKDNTPGTVFENFFLPDGTLEDLSEACGQVIDNLDYEAVSKDEIQKRVDELRLIAEKLR